MTGGTRWRPSWPLPNHDVYDKLILGSPFVGSVTGSRIAAMMMSTACHYAVREGRDMAAWRIERRAGGSKTM